MTRLIFIDAEAAEGPCGGLSWRKMQHVGVAAVGHGTEARLVIDVDGAEGHSGGLSWRKMHHTNHRGLKGRLVVVSVERRRGVIRAIGRQRRRRRRRRVGSGRVSGQRR